jgi:hypothetical protein
VLGVGGVVFDVAAEADDEVVDGAGVGVFVDAPDFFENLFAGDDLAFAVGEVAEEVGLHEGEVGDAVGGDELECVEADGAVVERVFVFRVRGVRGEDRLRCLLRGCVRREALPGGAAEEGFEADEENVEVEGLGEVVVGSGFDAFEDLFGARAGGEHEDWGVALGLAEGADNGEAVGSGEHAVEDDGGDVFVGVFIGREEVGESGVAVGLVVGAVAFGLEVEEEALGEVVFVFDYGDEGGGGFRHGVLRCAMLPDCVAILVTYCFMDEAKG